MKTQMEKLDKGKLRYDLIPTDALAEIALCLTIGAGKYGARNWELGGEWYRPFGAIQRHAQAFWSGASKDEEGFHHMAAVAVNAMMLIAFDLRGIGDQKREEI